jgi:hypothetical protein
MKEIHQAYLECKDDLARSNLKSASYFHSDFFNQIELVYNRFFWEIKFNQIIFTLF